MIYISSISATSLCCNKWSQFSSIKSNLRDQVRQIKPHKKRWVPAEHIFHICCTYNHIRELLWLFLTSKCEWGEKKKNSKLWLGDKEANNRRAEAGLVQSWSDIHITILCYTLGLHLEEHECCLWCWNVHGSQKSCWPDLIADSAHLLINLMISLVCKVIKLQPNPTVQPHK